MLQRNQTQENTQPRRRSNTPCLEGPLALVLCEQVGRARHGPQPRELQHEVLMIFHLVKCVIFTFMNLAHKKMYERGCFGSVYAMSWGLT